MTPQWADFFKIFTYQFAPDPYSRRANTRDLSGAGVTQPDAIPMMGPDGSMSGSGDSRLVRFRDTNEMIDLSSVSNRQSRYKEYQRLLGVPEIDRALTVFADEACLAGWTKVQTPHGEFTIEQLAKTRANDRFLVYCYDHKAEDYTLGWAYAPRKTKTAKTIVLVFDNGKLLTLTHDHRIMTGKGTYVQAGDVKVGDEMMPFYRLRPNPELNKLKTGQQPRIYSHQKGWINERQFVDDWKSGKTQEQYEEANKISRLAAGGLVMDQILKQIPHDWKTIKSRLAKVGFTYKELKKLGQKEKVRRVVDIRPGPEIDVYDMSVEKHENFCTDSIVVHNCQKDEFGNLFKIECSNREVVEEAKHFFFHRQMLNMNRKAWAEFRKLCLLGDLFWEAIINREQPGDGIANFASLPAESMYRIETTKGKLIEFQQAREGPDYNALVRAPIMQATDAEIAQSTAIRFAPEQIVHIRIGDDRKTFYPYGVSLVEPARGPAHQLRLMEDAMLVYRLCLTEESRVRTNEGYKSIKDIVAGDVIFGQKDDKNVLTKVIWQKSHGSKAVRRIKTKHTQLTGTPDHPVLTERNGEISYKQISQLEVGKDRLVYSTNLDGEKITIPRTVGSPWAKLCDEQRSVFRSKKYHNRSALMKNCGSNADRVKQFLYSKNKSLPLETATKICKIFDLDPTKLIIVSRHQRNHDRIQLPVHVTEDFARLFGFLLGDGFMSRNTFGICAGTDLVVNKKYADLLRKFFGKAEFGQDKRRSAGQGKYTVCNTVAVELLKEMGYIPDHDNCRIPQWVFCAEPNIRRAFVEGISDADGCERYTKKGTWFSTLELHNEKLIEDIKEVWSSIGLCSGHIGKRFRKERLIDGKRCAATESWTLTVSEKILPQYEKVISVEDAGVQEVYDIEVENESHNFVANGVIVHNSRSPERRVFYIDVGQLPPFKAEAFVERLKDQFRKKKVATNRSPYQGANQVEERWHAPAVDEDYWLPIRGDSQTKIDTLPGAQNLGEIDDAVYFRNKLFVALNFPPNYLSNEDPNATRITLSAQDVKFARMIERLQGHFEDGLWEMLDRHLQMIGYPPDVYDDLVIKMTPPSDWRELSRAETTNNRVTTASSLKSAQLMSDYDVHIRYLRHSEEETEEMIARLKIQKLEELKLQILAQNPQLLGVGTPGAEGQDGQEIGSQAGGPSPMLGSDPAAGGAGGAAPPLGGGLAAEEPPEGGPGNATPDAQKPQGKPLADPEEEEIMKYDLEIQSYDAEQDVEDIDYSVNNE